MICDDSRLIDAVGIGCAFGRQLSVLYGSSQTALKITVWAGTHAGGGNQSWGGKHSFDKARIET